MEGGVHALKTMFYVGMHCAESIGQENSEISALAADFSQN
jgi:hypothetical protein